MGVKFTVTGLDEVLRNMENINPVIDEELTKELNSNGMDWQADVRANTPVGETGDLHRSWNFEPATKTGTGFEMSLSNNTEYANHVEFGHRTRNLKGYVKGVYMLRRGTIALEERLPAGLERAMKRAGDRLE